MDNTHFSNRVALLATMYFFYKDQPEKLDDAWAQFFAWADIALPLSFAIHYQYATPTDLGRAQINDAWEYACNLFGVDYQGTYESIEQMQEIGKQNELDRILDGE